MNSSPLRPACLWAFLAAALPGAAGEFKIPAKLEPFAEGFAAPTALVAHPLVERHLVVLEQTGTAWVVGPDGNKTAGPFLDLRSRMIPLNAGFDERGFLGLAFHPRVAENGRLYVYYSAPKRPATPPEWDHTSRISEFHLRAGDPQHVDLSTERVLMEFDQPYFNHNGGCLLFGPDGFLYVSTGDGGNANDQGRREAHGNGQDRMTVLGKILRIDVNHGEPYAIPADNPFPDGAGRPEIFALGLRNPWKISFDRGGDRRLFAADVGQGLFEEVNIIQKGSNYGWNIREGFHGFDPAKPNVVPEKSATNGLAGEPLSDPILEYKNLTGFRNDPEALGISVTGGYVYRGKAIPELEGRYVFGDWSRSWGKPEGVLLVASPPAEPKEERWKLEKLSLSSHPQGMIEAYVTAFGEDAEGELYVLTNGGNTPGGGVGKVWKLVPDK